MNECNVVQCLSYAWCGVDRGLGEDTYEITEEEPCRAPAEARRLRECSQIGFGLKTQDQGGGGHGGIWGREFLVMVEEEDDFGNSANEIRMTRGGKS